MLEVNYDKQHQQFYSANNPPPFTFAPTPSDVFAVIGGTFAALASLCAKIMVDTKMDTAAQLVRDLFGDVDSYYLNLGSRAVMLSLVAVCNGLMWLFFTKALRFSSSSTRVTLIQIITNFIVTAILGSYVFGDVLSVQWWFGASLIAVGFTVISSPKDAAPVTDVPQAKKNN
ncbi:hypothetical protein EV182_002828 [Spiromyces aspiralis]|uniref:Uncharacterized protein n=1 Tax=Spiromyces aspiralis TaxID=68401 RepID=A0ACC1HG04_9FUNG|nr:hypothetical protein EV182_002828 [Spiromyces aspiralis]